MTESNPSSTESKNSNESISLPPTPEPRAKRKYVRRAKPISFEEPPPPVPDHILPPVPPKPSAGAMLAKSAGLDPRLGFCRLIPLDGGEIFVPSYRGLVKLAMDSGELSFFDAQPIFEKDDFALDLGQQLLKHAPWAGDEGPGKLVGAYAQAIDRAGRRQIAYVPGRDIWTRAQSLFLNGCTTEEVARKIAALELFENSYLSLQALRWAVSVEPRKMLT